MRTLCVCLMACLLVSCSATPTPIKLPTLPPAATPTYLRIVFDIMDDVTGQPVNGEITIRRERLADGVQVEAAKFFTGNHLEIEAPNDPEVRLFVLVEATGYADWEVGLRTNKSGTLKAPIRLKLISTLRTQG